MATIKTIKKDAIVKVDLGTGFIQKLQELMMFIANQHSTEELNKFKELATTGQPLEDWMTHLTTISVLIREVEAKADEQGFIQDSEAPEPIVEGN